MNRKIQKLLDIQTHISIIGEMIEETETSIRQTIEIRDILKSKEIIDNCRYSSVLGKPNIEGANKLKDVFLNKNWLWNKK